MTTAPVQASAEESTHNVAELLVKEALERRIAVVFDLLSPS